MIVNGTTGVCVINVRSQLVADLRVYSNPHEYGRPGLKHVPCHLGRLPF